MASGKTRSIVGDCGLSIKYEYDKNGDVESTAVPGEGKNKSEFDQHGLVIKETIEGADLETVYERDPLGVALKTTQPGGIIVTQGVDALGRATTTGIMDTLLTRHMYANDDP